VLLLVLDLAAMSITSTSTSDYEDLSAIRSRRGGCDGQEAI
jgi:hypothetical protein